MYLQTQLWDFGAPLKRKSGIDSWILLHPDERERLLLLLLLFIRIMGALVAKMMAPLHNIQYTVQSVHKI